MEQVLIEDDVRIENGLSLDVMWLGQRWSAEVLEDVMRSKYPQPYRPLLRRGA
jgi:hypothetical protein